MFKTLRLKNFQCHKTLTIDFDEYVSVVCGASDIGKSAILRALRWLCLNKPSGSGFLRSGAKGVSVRLCTESGLVKRLRSRQRNEYLYRDQAYRSLGAGGVPEGITLLLNVSEDSFQLQHDPPYWLSESPGQVAKNLNRIVDLSLIDSTLANLASELRKAKIKVEVSEQRLTSCTEQLSTLTWVQEANGQLTVLESMEVRLQQKRSRIAQIEAGLAKVLGIDQALQNAARVHREAVSMIRLGDRVLDLRTRREQLQETLNRCSSWERQERQIRQELTEVNGRLESLSGSLCPVCGQEIRALLPS